MPFPEHFVALPKRDFSPMIVDQSLDSPSIAISAPAATAATFDFFDWALLPVLMILTPLIYLFRVRYNLPVSANVDERWALVILQRFEHGLNPHFFLYPTLYYYVTFLFLKLIPSASVLVWGRILNLSFVGLTGFLAYSFCRIYFQSRAAGILAAVFIVSSTTVINSGSYMCPDPLLAALTVASLILLMRYFEKPGQRNWILAMLMLGLTVGCKYTAFLLFIAYAVTEMIREWQKGSDTPENDSGPRLSVRFLTIAFVALGCVCLIAAWLLPVQQLLQFANTHHTDPDLKSATDYLTFFQHVRMKLILGGGGLLALALVVWRWSLAYRLLSLRRLYLGLLIVGLVTVVTTPYSVLDPAKFIYDIGAQARGTVMIANGHVQWLDYFFRLGNESVVLLLCGLTGLVLIVFPNWRRYQIVIVFVALYAFVIGNAKIGFPRYLTPLLPVIYIFAGAFLIEIWNWRPRAFPYAKVLAALLIALAAAELRPKIESSYALSQRNDAFWNSYHAARDAHAEKVLYAGFAPFAELIAAGIPSTQTSWASLASMPLGNQIACGELMILDRRAAETHHVVPETDPSVTVLLDDRSGDYGQEVLKRTGCN
jgi:hypothetical protein